MGVMGIIINVYHVCFCEIILKMVKMIKTCETMKTSSDPSTGFF